MGNVEAYVHISDAPGIQSPIDDGTAARNKALRRTDFPSKVDQITSTIPGIEIVEQHDQAGSVSMTVALDRFEMLHTFMQQHPELGTIADFQTQEIPDEPILHAMLQENEPGFTASPEALEYPSSSTQVVQCP